MTDIVQWVVVAAVFLLAGLVKGVVGMGLPTISMGLLALVMAPAEAAAILIVPSFVTNVWQLVAGPAFGALLKRLWTMMIGILAGTLATAGLLSGGHTGATQIGLGVALVLYALLGLSARRFHVPSRHESWLSPFIGVTTGLVAGATGVFVIPAVPYLQALDLKRDDLIQALGLSFTVSTIALAAGLSRTSHFDVSSPLVVVSLLALAPALLGMFAGQSLRSRMSVETFRRVFFAGLLLLGLYLSVEGVVTSLAARHGG